MEKLDKKQHDNSELVEHLICTAELSGRFADKFDNRRYGFFCGILHDIGKFSDEFDRSINDGYEYPEYADGTVQSSKYGYGGKLMSYCISGMKSGLLNYGRESKFAENTLFGIITKYDDLEELPECIADKVRLPIMPVLIPFGRGGFSFSFFVRMVFSCLVDSDCCNGESEEMEKPDYYGWAIGVKNVMKHFARCRSRKSDICCEAMKQAEKHGNCEKSIYSMTVPDVLEKEFCAMAFAASHAKENNLDRIIYVVSEKANPERTAGLIRRITAEASEYYSDVNLYNKDDLWDKWTDNVIVTTHEHFFSSCFSAQKNTCRKLHNFANSMIIIDGFKAIDDGIKMPCINVIVELVRNYSSTVLLADNEVQYWQKLIPAVEKPDKIKLPEYSKMPEIIYGKATEVSGFTLILYDDFSQAMELYEKFNCQKLFLSEKMCAAHRRKILRAAEKKPSGRKKMVLFAQKAVMLDFSTVICLNDNIDLILEAVKSCSDSGKVIICGNDVSADEIFDQQFLKNFYDKNYSEKSIFDAREIGNLLDNNGMTDNIDESFNFPFRTVSDRMAGNCTLIIPFDDTARRFIEEIDIIKSSRVLQEYCINISRELFRRMSDDGSVMLLSDSTAILTDKSLYSEDYGLII